MSLNLSGEITAVATAVLAFFAIVTPFYAVRAFRKQAQEVRAIEQQVKDQEELTRQQAELLKIQSGQLELQREQLGDQRSAIEDQVRANARQAEVLELQATELRESLAERKREAEDQRRSQAVRVTAWFAEDRHGIWGARVCNDSDLPVVNVRTFFNYIAETSPGGDWEPVPRGGPVEKIRVLPPRTDRLSRSPTRSGTR
jgi:hypothetical protein